jgi:hypothetical protein
MSLVGKRVLVGLTKIDRDGTTVERRQMIARVAECSAEAGIVVRAEEDPADEVRLPYSTESLVPAPVGSFRLHDAEREVVSPDFMTSWVFEEGDDGIWRARSEDARFPGNAAKG